MIEEFKENPTNIPIWALQSWEKALNKGVITEKTDPYKFVMSSTVEKMLVKLGIFQKSEEDITMVRWVVPLEKP